MHVHHTFHTEALVATSSDQLSNIIWFLTCYSSFQLKNNNLGAYDKYLQRLSSKYGENMEFYFRLPWSQYGIHVKQIQTRSFFYRLYMKTQ